MSLNLALEGIELWQTPTNVTVAAREGNFRQAKEVYFAWIDDLAAWTAPKFLPSLRMSNAQRKAIESTPEYKFHLKYLRGIEEHKRAVEEVLRKDPAAKWSVR